MGAACGSGGRGCQFDPWLLLADCQSVPEQDTTLTAPVAWLSPLLVCECVHEWVNTRQYFKEFLVATGQKGRYMNKRLTDISVGRYYRPIVGIIQTIGIGRLINILKIIIIIYFGYCVLFKGL